MTHRITVYDGERICEFEAREGEILRDRLLDTGCSPYTRLTGRANCGGRGLCATCGVRLSENVPPPAHWHDRLADCFGYPRLSCQVRIDRDLMVVVPEKSVWGERRER
jgi:ferredoxin